MAVVCLLCIYFYFDWVFIFIGSLYFIFRKEMSGSVNMICKILPFEIFVLSDFVAFVAVFVLYIFNCFVLFRGKYSRDKHAC